MADVIEGAREPLTAALAEDVEYYVAVGDGNYKGPSDRQGVAELVLGWARGAVPGTVLNIATGSEPDDEGHKSFVPVATVTGNGIEKAPDVKKATAKKSAAKK